MQFRNLTGAPLYVDLDDISLVYENNDPTQQGTLCLQKTNGEVLFIREEKEKVTQMIKKAEEERYGSPPV